MEVAFATTPVTTKTLLQGSDTTATTESAKAVGISGGMSTETESELELQSYYHLKTKVITTPLPFTSP